MDRFDKFRSTISTMRREKQIPMSNFTDFRYASVQNALTILQSIVVLREITYAVREFKRKVDIKNLYSHLLICSSECIVCRKTHQFLERYRDVM